MAKAPRKTDKAGRPARAAPKGLSDEDLALWRHVTRADIRLPGREYSDLEEGSDETPGEPTGTPKPAAVTPRRADRPAAPESLAEPPLEPGRPAGVDKRTAQRLRRGQLAIQLGAT